MDENELISEIKSGNKEAFKTFILNYQKIVINICYKFLGNADDANDVAQEVFIEVYKTIDKFRSESRISTWLYRIAVNRSLNYLRDNRKSKITDSYSDNPQNIISYSSNDTPEASLINKEKLQVINKAIDSLPESQKAAFILNKKDDLSYVEISKILNVSVKAVESLLMRAKKNLQKLLIDYYSNS